MRERDDELEATDGTNLEQMISMLEESEIDYEGVDDGDEKTVLIINQSVEMIFDEDGILVFIGTMQH